MDSVDPVTVKGKNRALPFKAELVDTDGLPVTDENILYPPVIQLSYTAVLGDATVEITDTLPAGKGTEGNQFEYTGGKWQFNLKTTDLGEGTYNVTMEPGLGGYIIDTTCEASFEIKPR
jgi:hypothetical protein